MVAEQGPGTTVGMMRELLGRGARPRMVRKRGGGKSPRCGTGGGRDDSGVRASGARGAWDRGYLNILEKERQET